MRQYIEYPLPFGINLVTQLSDNNLYQISKSQTAVFPFILEEGVSAIRIDAGHSSFYDNQQGTLHCWASNEINGRSITADSWPGQNRISLQGSGFSWLFHTLDANSAAYEKAAITQWIYPSTKYYMCFQNTENKTNGLFVKFSYLP
jgi:hypothetical protein